MPTSYNIMGKHFWNAQQTSYTIHDMTSFTVTRGQSIHYVQEDSYMMIPNGGYSNRKIIGSSIRTIVFRLRRVSRELEDAAFRRANV